MVQEESEVSAAADSASSRRAPAHRPRRSSMAGMIEREANAYAALRKQWAYKLAKQAVDQFHKLFAPYK